jgi:hypothetical protein
MSLTAQAARSAWLRAPIRRNASVLLALVAYAPSSAAFKQASLRGPAVLLGSMVLATIISNWVPVLIIMATGYTSGMHDVLVTRGARCSAGCFW